MQLVKFEVFPIPLVFIQSSVSLSEEFIYLEDSLVFKLVIWSLADGLDFRAVFLIYFLNFKTEFKIYIVQSQSNYHQCV